jgi:hypothetical protein
VDHLSDRQREHGEETNVRITFLPKQADDSIDLVGSPAVFCHDIARKEEAVLSHKSIYQSDNKRFQFSFVCQISCLPLIYCCTSTTRADFVHLHTIFLYIFSNYFYKFIDPWLDLYFRIPARTKNTNSLLLPGLFKACGPTMEPTKWAQASISGHREAGAWGWPLSCI